MANKVPFIFKIAAGFLIICILLLIVIPLIFIFNSPISNKADIGLWGVIKSSFSFVLNLVKNVISVPLAFIWDKVSWITGGQTWQGKSVWKIEYLFEAIAILIFGLIFSLIGSTLKYFGEVYTGLPYDWVDLAVESLRSYFKKIVIPAILFLILMFIPIINRIIQVITFEILDIRWIFDYKNTDVFTGIGFPWWLRAFIIAAVLYFFPLIWKEYVRFSKRKREYREKLDEEFGREMLRQAARA
ncbi:hypothetical protein HYW74_04825 [Candidatus Pacearchaeota archaeon]|nr:hypothetical protein [Candidatus Pacearchaeota archaeon]